jgi:hypothetical protein
MDFLTHIPGNELRSTVPRGTLSGGLAMASETRYPRIFTAADVASHAFWTYPVIVGRIMSALSCVVALPLFLAGWVVEVSVQSFRNGRAMASAG